MTMSNTKLEGAATSTPAVSNAEIARRLNSMPVGELTDSQFLWAFADRLERSPSMADWLVAAGIRVVAK